MASESEEVAEDYRLALEDLSGNMRHEISNLTVIARENTEHALAIAEVLQQHILKVGMDSRGRLLLTAAVDRIPPCIVIHVAYAQSCPTC